MAAHTDIIKVFDLHSDTLSECYKHNLNLTDDRLHLSLDKLPEDYRLCQAMAVYMPDTYRGDEAEAYFDNIYQVFLRQLEMYSDKVGKVTDTSDVDSILSDNQFAMMLTVEGGSALAGKLENIKKMFDCGVKALTLTWNGENEICGGTATDIGFKPFGKRAVAGLERLGIVVDVSHLSDKGFHEITQFATRPFIASHSNSRKICPHPRNLTDDMFRVIRDMGGLVGVNYFEKFLVDGGGSKTIGDLLRHVHHFLELGGENTIALGSDFDGADVPPYLNGLDKLEHLRQSLMDSGITAEITDNIMYRNACKFFDNYSKNSKGCTI